jgi:hypothetical protein
VDGGEDWTGLLNVEVGRAHQYIGVEGMVAQWHWE